MRNGPELYVLGIDDLLLSHQEETAIPLLLDSAAQAVTSPTQSGYEVKVAAINEAGAMVNGGNREYGLSRAYVHGEEAVVSKLLSDHPDTPILGMGFYSEGTTPETVAAPAPCGNCRDVLVEESQPNLLLVAGNSQLAVATRLSAFLFNNFDTAGFSDVADNTIMWMALHAAHRARLRANTDYLSRALLSRVYGVALVDHQEQIFTGSFDTTASYDAITPGVSAIQTFRNRPEGVRHNLSKLAAVVIAGSTVSAPCYRDRDAILGLDITLQSDSDTFMPTPVYMFDTDTDGQSSRLTTTDTHQWIPFAFTDSALGMVDIARNKRKRLSEYL